MEGLAEGVEGPAEWRALLRGTPQAWRALLRAWLLCKQCERDMGDGGEGEGRRRPIAPRVGQTATPTVVALHAHACMASSVVDEIRGG